MAVLTQQFSDALTLIEPDADVASAIKAREAVVDALAADDQFTTWGFDPVLIGSYKRHVSIKRIKDVDVFCRLRNLPDGVDPVDLLGHTLAVLTAAFPGDDLVTLQGRSVQVTFPELDMYVDAVPARPAGDVWEIPCKDPGDGWESTNPEQLTQLSTDMNEKFDGIYVPTVKLMRQARRSLRGDSKPGGLFIECVTYWAFDEFTGDFGSQAEYFVEALEGAVRVLDRHIAGSPIENPAMQGNELRVSASHDDFVALRDAFYQAAESARRGLADDDQCEAARTFRAILGQDSLGEWVFQLPEDCETYSESRSGFAVLPGADQLPAGDSPRFG